MNSTKSLFSSLGQLAEKVCRSPQVELITIANWDLSGSRDRDELMKWAALSLHYGLGLKALFRKLMGII